jgi:hypothetical protein
LNIANTTLSIPTPTGTVYQKIILITQYWRNEDSWFDRIGVEVVSKYWLEMIVNDHEDETAEVKVEADNEKVLLTIGLEICG